MKLISRVERFLITLSYCQPKQLVHRVRKLVRQRLIHRTAAYRRWLYAGFTGLEPTRQLRFPEHRSHDVDVQAIAEGRFTFLNRTYSLGRSINWSPEEPAKLWVYNLHYFEYAVSLAELAANGSDEAWDVFKDVVADWTRAHQRPERTAWHAYPVSLRICNWIKAYSLLEDRLASCPHFARDLRRSIATQARYLEGNLEYDLMNNHLLENGRALFNAGLFFDHPDAVRWQRKGMEILMLGLREHFLDDGAHEEVSPMYHQIMLELYIEMKSLLEQNRLPVPELLETRIDRGKDWLAATLHPDGKIALLNDAAFGITCGAKHVVDPQEDSPDGFHVFEQSHIGCFRNRDRADYLIVDNGELGPQQLPGHGHCDSLSYELSLRGQRVIVDAGVEHYHEDVTWRNYYRSTRAHNTVVVDGAEQSEIWGAFRVARRARPINTFHGGTGDPTHFWSSAHSGYQRLAGNVTHRRWVGWIDRRFWIVADCITGSGSHHLESLIHFHPEATVPSLKSEPVVRGDARLLVVPFGLPWGDVRSGETEPPQGWYAPEFGVRIPNIVWSLADTVELPAWFGYILWPMELDAPVSATLGSDGESGCEITVDAEKSWRVTIESKNQTMDATLS